MPRRAPESHLSPALLGLAALLALAPLAPAQNRQAEGAMLGADLLKTALSKKAADVIDLRGNTSFPAEELLGAIGEQVREIQASGLTPARADDAAFYIGAYYRKRGFASATADHVISGKKVIVTVREGPRSTLKEVRFAGNRAIKEETLYDYMIGATPERLAREPAQFPYTEAEVSAGGDRVRGLYLSEGYLNVKVDTSGVELSEGGTRATVTVRIEEGMRYVFGDVEFAGQTIYPREVLVEALGNPVNGTAPDPDQVVRNKKRAPALFAPRPFDGVSFSPGRANAMQRNLESFLKAQGYFTARVELTADYNASTDGFVPVTFTVVPSGLHRFDGVKITNQGAPPRLSPSFLQTRFAPLHGEVFNPRKLDELYREMLRTGLFSTLRVSTTAIAGDQVRLDITAEEAKAKEVGFTLGYSNFEGAMAGLRLGDRNLLGHGRPLTFAFDYSQRGMRGELLYVDPWLFDTRFSLRTRLFSVLRQEIGYARNEVGGRIDVTRKVLPHLELGAFIQSSQVKLDEIEPALERDPTLLGPRDYSINSIGLTQLTDLRDNAINPTRGLVVSSSFDFATIDGEPGFTRSTFRFSYYLPIGRTMLAVGARAGYISALADTVPIDVRFFNGGNTTVRSFPERQLGPSDTAGNPLGGDLFTVFNLELTFPVWQALQGAVFVDAGSIRNEAVEDNPEREEERELSGLMRYAVGLGLRYKLPIGPLRVDYGINPNPRAGEDFGAFHFSFGFAF